MYLRSIDLYPARYGQYIGWMNICILKNSTMKVKMFALYPGHSLKPIKLHCIWFYHIVLPIISAFNIESKYFSWDVGAKHLYSLSIWKSLSIRLNVTVYCMGQSQKKQKFITINMTMKQMTGATKPQEQHLSSSARRTNLSYINAVNRKI